MTTPRVVRAIYFEETVGRGTKEDPIRRRQGLATLDGELVALYDPHESEWKYTGFSPAALMEDS